MKIILQIMIIMALAFNSNAQIANNSFETWVSDSLFEEPVNWRGSNELYYGLDQFGATKTPTTVTKVSPGNTGNYAMQLKNVVDSTFDALSPTGWDPSDTLPAFEFGVSPYSQRPTAITGYYKFTQGAILPDIDSAFITVGLTKWNGTSRDTIGDGGIFITANASSFTGFTVPITFINGTTPDTIIFYIGSSLTNGYSATSLIVDDLSSSGVTGIKNSSVLFGKNISLYPNPALDEINVKNIPVEASAIDIRDYTGKKVQSLEVVSDFMNFKTNGLSSGMYFYSITDANGEVLYTDKFSVLK